MRFLIRLVFLAIVVIVLGAGAVVLLVPRDVVRDQVTAFIEEQTGRKLTIAGETSLSFFPKVGISIKDVTLSNPPGMAGGPTLRMDALDVNLALMPLISRDVQVRRFVMVRPVFDLRIDQSGRPNWLFETKTGSAPPAVERSVAERPAPALNYAQLGITPAFAQPLVRELSLDEVRIEDGTVQFADERSGAAYRADAVNLALSLPRLSAPLEAEGDLAWRGEKVGFKGRLDAVPALLDGGSSPLAVSLDARLFNGTLDGTLTAGDAVAVAGVLSAQSSSLRGLADWSGHPLPPGEGLGPMSFAGSITASADKITVGKARISLDSMTGQGEASVGLAGARPLVRAALSVDKLDLNPYLASSGGGKPEKPASAASQKPAPTPKPGQSLTDFIEELNRTEQAEAGSGLAALKAADAEVRLTAGEILYGNLKLGRSATTSTLKNGVLTTDLTDFRLYGGAGKGRLVFNGARAVPALSMRLDLDGVDALPLLKDAMGFDWISGKTKLSLDLSGAGSSASALKASLGGKGNVLFTDGAIEGINIPQMVRSIKNGQFTGWRRQEALKTDFSSLSGTLTMQNGIARNDDLELIGPLLRLTGSGTVDLPRSRVDYRFLPRLVASLEGQGGTQEQQLSGLVVPLRLEGPFDDLKLRPDLQRLIEDPELTKNAVEQAGKAVESLKKGGGKQLLQDLLGGGQTQEAQPEAAPQEGQPAEQRRTPQDILKGLFQ